MSDFDSKTKSLPGQRKASEAYIEQRRNTLLDCIEKKQITMNRINNDTSNELCNSQWDKKVQHIRNKVKNENYVKLSEFKEDFRNFEYNYRDVARGPYIDIVWNERKKVTDSWDANVKRSIMARSYDGKNVESIYDDIMNSTLNPIDQLAADLGWAWAGKF